MVSRLSQSVIGALFLLSPVVQGNEDTAKLAFFESRVRPILVEQCQNCHGSKKQQSSLRMDSREFMLKGGDSGPALVPGKPKESLIIKVLAADHQPSMPPKGPLPGDMVKTLETWVAQGAVWPQEAKKLAGGPPTAAEARKNHWAFQTPRKSEPPLINDAAFAGWNDSPVDRFIAQGLIKNQLSPAAQADRRTLLRRLSFDLTGLPPTIEEIEAFEKDTSPNAWEKQVDRVLQSPAYGERWGRHWLDLARYADTKGYVFQEERKYPYSWTYRDYVIRSLNEDKPYNRFLLEQLAADLLDLGQDKAPLAGLGYLTLGRRFLNNIHDIIDDRIDTVMRGLQGMTMGCARCHDHKFDPLSQKDYYSLYGIFSCSSEPAELPLLGPPKDLEAYKTFEKELANRQARIDAFLARKKKEIPERARKEIGKYMLSVWDEKRPASDRGPSMAIFVPQKQMLNRWKAFLAKPGLANDPVWKAWFALETLSNADFASKGSDILCDLLSHPDSSVDPAIKEALLAQAPWTSMIQVALAYGKAFENAHAQPKDPKHLNLAKILGDNTGPWFVSVDTIESYFDRADRAELNGLKKKIEEYRANSPGSPPRAMALEEKPRPNEHRVFLRGNPGNAGPVVKRRFPEVLSPVEAKPFEKGGGRLELAQSIASPNNPLTARVFVNRVWMLHFGEGLVRTPGDFGIRGEPPTHPELLDYLAARFVEEGWSIKKLHRLILTSRAWRQSSEAPEATVSRDPENRWVGRMNRRRLEFESQRDAMLFVSGKLQSRHEGPSVDLLAAPYPLKRTIYGFIDRQNLPGLYRTFDTASPDLATPRRHNTTVPQQALFWMNHPFTQELAKAVANRREIVEAPSVMAKITALYRLVFGRNPDAAEIASALDFLGPQEMVGPIDPRSQGPWEQYAQALLCCNEFVFVD